MIAKIRVLLVFLFCISVTAAATCDGFICPYADKCMYRSHRCDGTDECSFGDDERGCDMSKCGFNCANGACLLDYTWVCDGITDCAIAKNDQDYSDENACACEMNTNCDYWAKEGFCKNSSYHAYMFKNCKQACGYKCINPSDPSACIDKSLVCTYRAGLGHCTDPSYSSDMTEYCPRACGLCACTDRYVESCVTWAYVGHCTIEPYIESTKVNCQKTCGHCIVCTDYHKDCTYWKNEGHCTSSTYSEYMSENCRRACGHCTGPSSACRDKNTACVSWENSGFCTNSSYIEYMSDNCQRSCGKCTE